MKIVGLLSIIILSVAMAMCVVIYYAFKGMMLIWELVL